MEEQFIANQSEYLEAGIHIATKLKRPGMEKFIYKVRDDGLYLFDLKTIDFRIRIAASMISNYNANDVLVTASRIYAIVAAKKFSEIINAKFIEKRVRPGVFTDPNKEDFVEPKLVIVSDTRNEKQAVKEASTKNIPIIALCDTDNSPKYIDFVIPVNNKGRKALAFTFYLLAREVLKARGDIKSNEEFNYSIHDFEAQLQTEQKPDSSHQYMKPFKKNTLQVENHQTAPMLQQNDKKEIVNTVKPTEQDTASAEVDASKKEQEETKPRTKLNKKERPKKQSTSQTSPDSAPSVDNDTAT